jgi:hypothetical protein
VGLVSRRRHGLLGLRLAVAAFVLSAPTLARPAAVLAADPVVFGTPTASSTFGDGIRFRQPITVSAPLARVELLVSTPGDVGPTVEEITTLPGSGESTLEHRVDLSDGNTTPNTPFTGRWRVTGRDGTVSVGPAITEVYADDRFRWQTVSGSVVRVHWVEGDTAFARRALKLGDDAVAGAAKLLGVTETEPIDLFVYADQKAFYDALGPATRENVGGQADPEDRTVFALITPDEIDQAWVGIVVPHELTHVVFQAAVANAYHDPPHWLNEGVAVYLSAGYAETDRRQVEAAARTGTIIPLEGLAGAFPTTQDRFYLAYAESVSAVDRVVRANGRDALVQLIRSYREGVSDDAAFQAALGRNVAGFQADWLKELGAVAPTRNGPRPAPAGPLPPGWAGPLPNPSFEIVGSFPPAPTAPRPVPGLPDPIARLLAPSVSVLGLVLVVVLIVLAQRRLRRGGAAPVGAGEAGWNRLFGRAPSHDGETTSDPSGAAGAPLSPAVGDDPADAAGPERPIPRFPGDDTR